MTNIININVYQNTELAKYPYSSYYDEESAQHFGTHLEWDDDDVMYLMERLKNYMYETDETGSLMAMIALDLALTAYQKDEEAAPEECKAIIEHINQHLDNLF